MSSNTFNPLQQKAFSFNIHCSEVVTARINFRSAKLTQIKITHFFLNFFSIQVLFGKADGTEFHFWVQFDVHISVVDAGPLNANPGF